MRSKESEEDIETFKIPPFLGEIKMEKSKVFRVCKNCGAVITREEYEDVLRFIRNTKRQIENLQEQLEELEERKRLMENGFCGEYCESRYSEG